MSKKCNYANGDRAANVDNGFGNVAVVQVTVE